MTTTQKPEGDQVIRGKRALDATDGWAQCTDEAVLAEALRQGEFDPAAYAADIQRPDLSAGVVCRPKARLTRLAWPRGREDPTMAILNELTA